MPRAGFAGMFLLRGEAERPSPALPKLANAFFDRNASFKNSVNSTYTHLAQSARPMRPAGRYALQGASRLRCGRAVAAAAIFQ